MAKSKIESEGTDGFAVRYPQIADWVMGGGYVEIGQTSYECPAFVKALDEGGMIWEGKTKYPTLDAALQALEDGIAAFLEENG